MLGRTDSPWERRTALLVVSPCPGSAAGRGGALWWRLSSHPLPAGSPYALIVRRYLSLLDAAVELEFRDYSGPRLDPRYRVLMFEHALTADEANRKYRSAAGAGGVLGRGGLRRAGGAWLGVGCAGHPPPGPCGWAERCRFGCGWVTLFWQDPG